LAEIIREGLADRVPPGWREGRRVVPARAALAAVVLAVALVAGLVAHRMAADPSSVTVPAAGASSQVRSRAAAIPAVGGDSAAGSVSTVGSAAAAASAAPSSGGGVLVVDVEGKVRRPGLVRVPGGSRVADAVEAAGGPAPGAALVRINLARPLSDGEQVVVPGPNDPIPPGVNGSGGAGGSGGGSAGSGAGSAGGTGSGNGPVDLNTATVQQLDALPGIGPVLAGRIVAWRTEHGRFTSVDQLSEVSGIGDALMGKLRPLVRV
jgi:competence protein ComEA